MIVSGALLVMATASFAQTEIASVKKQEKVTRHQLREEKKEARLVKKEENIKEPDYMTARQFSIDFPNATDVNWSKKDFEKASFMENGKKLSAFYDFNSKLIGTVRDASFDGLPEAAKKHIARYYPGYTPQAVILFDDNESNATDMILYDTRFNDADNYFVEMRKGDKNIVLMVSLPGEVSYFTNMNGRVDKS